MGGVQEHCAWHDRRAAQRGRCLRSSATAVTAAISLAHRTAASARPRLKIIQLVTLRPIAYSCQWLDKYKSSAGCFQVLTACQD